MPTCDLCTKPAVVNYQTGMTMYLIDDSGKYHYEESFPDDEVNDHFCEEHDTEENRN